MKLAMMMVLAGALMAGVAGCGSGENAPVAGGSGAGSSTEKVPADIVLSAAPEGVKSIEEIKKSASKGDEVVIRGYVGGRKDPFTSHRAMMLVVDKGMANTCTTEADHCPTPWDYCCEDKGKLSAQMATVQVSGADGKLVKADLKGVGGLKELSEVVIKGKVAQKDEGVLVINATGIHVAK